MRRGNKVLHTIRPWHQNRFTSSSDMPRANTSSRKMLGLQKRSLPTSFSQTHALRKYCDKESKTLQKQSQYLLRQYRDYQFGSDLNLWKLEFPKSKLFASIREQKQKPYWKSVGFCLILDATSAPSLLVSSQCSKLYQLLILLNTKSPYEIAAF